MSEPLQIDCAFNDNELHRAHLRIADHRRYTLEIAVERSSCTGDDKDVN